MPDGRVIITGHHQSPHGDTADIYDHNLSTVTKISATMSTGRHWHTGTLLFDARVLFAGGWTEHNDTADIVSYTEYDYAAVSSALQPSITEVRKNGAAVTDIVRGGTYTIIGSRLKTNFEGSSGTSNSAEVNYPRVYLQKFTSGNVGPMSEGGMLLDVTPSVYALDWADAGSQISFTVPADLPRGYWKLFVKANGIPSEAVSLRCVSGPPRSPSNLLQGRTESSITNLISMGSWTNSNPYMHFKMRNYDIDKEMSFHIQWSTSPGYSPLAGEFMSDPNYRDDDAAYHQILTGLKTDKSYYWRVRSIDEDGFSSAWAYANDGDIEVKFDTAPPVNFGVESVETTKNSATPSYFTAYDTGSGMHSTPWMSVGSTDPAFGTVMGYDYFTNMRPPYIGLSPNTTYYFKEKVRDAAGNETDWSEPFSAVTKANEPVPRWDAEKRINNLRIDWDVPFPPNPPDTFYLAEVSTSSGFLGDIKPAPIGTEADLLAVVPGLNPNTTYYGRLSAINWAGDYTTVNIDQPKVTGCADPDLVNVEWDVYSSSVTLTWTPMDNNPDNTLYIFELSEDDGFGVVTSSAQAQRSEGSVIIESLTPNTTYYARVRARSHAGDETSSIAIGSNILRCAPPAPRWDSIFVSSITVAWDDIENPEETLYIVKLSTDSSFAEGTVRSSETIRGAGSAIISGLIPNTTYYGKIRAVSYAGAITIAFIDEVEVTLCSMPVPDWPEMDVFVSSVTVPWNSSSPPNPDDTRYLLQVTYNKEAAEGTFYCHEGLNADGAINLDGITPNTTYFARLKVLGHGGDEKASEWSDAFVTLAAAVVDTEWDEVLITSLKVVWSTSAVPVNPEDTVVIVDIATDQGFTENKVSSVTVFGAGMAAFTDIIPNNTEYYARVRAINHSGVESVTLLDEPIFLGIEFPDWEKANHIALGTDTIRWNWVNNDDFTTRIDIHCPVEGAKATELTGNATYYIESGLEVNTSYYRFLRVYKGGESEDTPPDYVYTLSNPPVLPSVDSVYTSSVTVSWGNNDNPPYTRWKVERALDENFTTGVAVRVNFADNLTATEFTDTGLEHFTDYYWRVSAFNGDEVETDHISFSTKTLYTVNPKGNDYTSAHMVNNVLIAELRVTGGTFGDNTAGMVLELTGGEKNAEKLADGRLEEGSYEVVAAYNYKIVDLFGNEVDYDGLAAGSIKLRFYLPAGFELPDKRTFRVVRLNVGEGRWEFIEDYELDSENNWIEASLNRLSVFKVVSIPVSTLKDIYVYPNPFKPGDSVYGASAGGGVTFGNLPENAVITIFNIAGEFVEEIKHSSGAAASWPGAGKVASGVYVYTVTSPDVSGVKTGKFMVVK